MSKISRLLVAVGALLLLALYVTPMWRIDLKAPQYPEGVGLRIWVDTIAGMRPGDVQSINGLNHYVGMAPIEVEGFPELRYMPVVVGALVALGLLTAALGRRPLLYAYAAVFAVAAGLGLYDFYRWGYQYGHNLDPTAAIKIPGASYQPPVIGTKQILNFVATSWPDTGGIAALVTGLLVLAAVVLEARRRPAGA